ncbi:uncharacterized protein PHACADRAFT_251383 [Phanerochaete carnosa HHB-10118-sp]|uniref:Hydrophobin n=1 Tax=Phanerochaete carnosa (strain HHB-10118-sp) TaxID=650164 RepID=K5WEB1_PHACS|nr:uncharacterized protein PHACADRAFT_251383 [Phanerochaete carnosa HHB-10118-sp]EKM57645.1 hypothetical protein PHACADRAFT_251383 [Phanerochaete carnosa HHB-10118-sp]
MRCCDTYAPYESDEGKAYLKEYGLEAQSGSGGVGLSCSSIIPALSDTCSSNPVCCTDDDDSVLSIVVGCTPIQL